MGNNPQDVSMQLDTKEKPFYVRLPVTKIQCKIALKTLKNVNMGKCVKWINFWGCALEGLYIRMDWSIVSCYQQESR